MKWIAHRGFSYNAPENTIPAFLFAAEDEFIFGIECDIHTTIDDEFIVIHDDTTDRMTKVKKAVKDLTLSEIKDLTIKNGNKARSFKDLKIPTLTEYLDICVSHQKTAIIEVKSVNHIDLLSAFVAIIESYLDLKVIVISSNLNYLKYLRAISDLELQLITERIVDSLIYDCRVNQIDFAIKKSIADEKTVSKLKKKGFKINVWTITSHREAQKLVTLGVDYLTTGKILHKR
jgi:glycerophosphoryl diester phosphodiesterase